MEPLWRRHSEPNVVKCCGKTRPPTVPDPENVWKLKQYRLQQYQVTTVDHALVLSIKGKPRNVYLAWALEDTWREEHWTSSCRYVWPPRLSGKSRRNPMMRKMCAWWVLEFAWNINSVIRIYYSNVWCFVALKPSFCIDSYPWMKPRPTKCGSSYQTT